jgi:hypothetical protein
MGNTVLNLKSDIMLTLIHSIYNKCWHIYNDFNGIFSILCFITLTNFQV